MNTYRVTVVDVTAPLAPLAHVAYVRGEKYGPAWQNARAALDGDKRGKTAHAWLYTDEACGVKFTRHGEAFTVGRVDDMKARAVKLDASALRDVMNGAGNAESKLAALAALVGVK